MFCVQCGMKLENGVCPRCGARVENSNTSLSTGAILKCIFVPLEIAVCLFVITAVISVLYSMFTANGEPTTAIERILVKGVLPLFQIAIPMLIALFGWIPMLIKETTKAKK